MEKGFVYRAYPNAKQRELIKKTFGCKRFVYNYFLRLRIDTYEKTKKTLSYNVCSKRLTDLAQRRSRWKRPWHQRPRDPFGWHGFRRAQAA